MKVLLINGSPHREGCTYTALCEVSRALNDNGVDTDIFWILVLSAIHLRQKSMTRQQAKASIYRVIQSYTHIFCGKPYPRDSQ